MSEKKERKCFIITPIGDDNSEIFRKAKGVIECVIQPVLKQNDYNDVKASYEINKSGMITTQIISRIQEDDLVIANLTGNNPNVMYELCLRHVTAKPIIHICEKGTALPFDIKDCRTIFYTNDMYGAKELMCTLQTFLKEMPMTDDYMDNPVYTAQRYEKLLKETQGTKENEMFQILLDIKNKLSEDIEETSKNYQAVQIDTDVHIPEFLRVKQPKKAQKANEEES